MTKFKLQIPKPLTLYFDGYYPEESVSAIPDESGIYIAYSIMRSDDDEAILDKPLYIGKAQSLRERIGNHFADTSEQKQWHRHMPQGYEVMYSYAPCPPEKLDIAEANLVFVNKPVCNIQLKDNFNGNIIQEIASIGACPGIIENIRFTTIFPLL